ncbi:MAG: hypothetical protein B9S34_01745 [Opitutia bacterium Tous-C1TDCM]|nr:MAG: hypothetical protein B9S34_01745 [Opitutae bacterium Tous-C1TDCM]
MSHSLFRRVTDRLHRSPRLRRFAKRWAQHLVLTQPFHGGRIAFNAVTHSWAWTGGRSYETFDRHIQDRLLELAATRPRFLDVGANVGVMTLSLLLRNPQVTAVAVEPGAEAADLLRRSIRRNRLGDRVEVAPVAASVAETTLRYDGTGSVMGHVSAGGTAVAARPLRDLVRAAARGGPDPLLIKIDIEGFETELLPALLALALPAGSAAVIELHPQGFNGMGDPAGNLARIRAVSGIRLQRLGGSEIGQPDVRDFTQVEIHWV